MRAGGLSTLFTRLLAMKNRRMSALVAIPVLVLALAACGGGGGGTTKSGVQLVSSGTLTVCSDVPFPPFEDFDKSSPTGFKGFDIDIVTQIAKGMKLEPRRQGLRLRPAAERPRAELRPVRHGRERDDDHARPPEEPRLQHGYYDSKQSLLVPNGSDITSIDDLSGKKVGVQQGTTGKSYAEENATGADIVTFPSDAEEYQAIKAGQVDALLQDLPVNLEHTKTATSRSCRSTPPNEQYGLAMKKGNTAAGRATSTRS